MTIGRIVAAAILMALLAGCGSPGKDTEPAAPQETETVAETAAPEETPAPTATPEDEPEVEAADQASTEEENTMTITIGDYQFKVTLEDNAAAAALKEHLPLTLDMSELNGNEKYNYMPFSLPTETYSPGTIQTGDVMLYGDSCLVVFYKSFSTPYTYTKIGHIDDAAELQTAVGTGSVQMVFES